MISTTLGVGVFLLFVTFAAHVLLNLWLSSTLDAVGRDAATTVALSAGDPSAAEREALDRARRQLGNFASRVRIDVERDAAGESVTVRVRCEGLRLVPDVLGSLRSLGAIDRRYPVRREVAR